MTTIEGYDIYTALYNYSLSDEQVANLREWAEALESGTYGQTTGALKDKKGYCCLGVECDLFAKRVEGWRWERNEFVDLDYAEIDGDDDGYLDHEGGAWDTQLPLDVMNSIGLRTASGDFGGVGNSLIALNDDEGYEFVQIAQTLRAKFLEQFGVAL